MGKASVLEGLLVAAAAVSLSACQASATTNASPPDLHTTPHVVQLTAPPTAHSAEAAERSASASGASPSSSVGPRVSAPATSPPGHNSAPTTRPPEAAASSRPPKGPASSTGAPVVRPGTALAALATLPVKGRAPRTGYDRALFGQAWTDDIDVQGGHNGCDTRNDVLRRDLHHVTLKPGTYGCVVLAGTLDDPYTGSRIGFVRGVGTSSAVQIDHVVALSNAWQTGAQQLAAERRQDLAGDPLNLWAVQGRANMQKGDGDAATWLPSHKAIRCRYVARQVAVKHRYDLWVTAPERDAIERILRRCPSQPLPTETGWATPPPDRDAAPAAPPRETSPPRRNAGTQHTRPSSSAVPSASRPSTPAQQPDPSIYYKNCDAVRAAGAAPVRRGDPGYARHLDRDGDGVGCEP